MSDKRAAEEQFDRAVKDLRGVIESVRHSPYANNIIIRSCIGALDLIERLFKGMLK